MTVRVQLRRGTAAQWTSADPTLASGEMGLETDTGKFKVGDGVSAWGVLPYSSGPAGPAGPIGATGTVAAAGDGTEALPGIAFASDLNTGIYRPGADQLALSTNGTGRLFVDANGNVKVGTSSGSAAAENLTVTGFAGIGDRTAVGPFLLAGNTGGGNGVLGTFSNHALELRTNNTEKLRITSAGLVGIGTSSPSARLEVRTVDSSTTIGGSSSVIKLANDSGVLNSTSGIEFFHSTNTSLNTTRLAGIYGLYKSFNASGLGGDLVFATNTAGDGVIDERMRITSTGNVGIGTTSPLGTTHIQSSSTGLSAVNNAGDELVIEGGGNSGITILAGNTSQSSIYFADSDNAQPGSINYNHSDNSLALRVNGSERARIDSSGRLLVGTSVARVTRLGTTSITPLVQTLDGGAGGFLVYNNVASPNPATIYAAKSRGNDYTSAVQSGDNLFKISAAGADGTQATEAASIAIAVDGTPGTNSMPGRIVLSTTPTGSASPVERMRIKSSGIINFSNAPVYADNTAALAGGLVAGDVYRKSDGTLMITY